MEKFTKRIIQYSIILIPFFFIESMIFASQGYIPDCSVDLGIPIPAGFPNENTTGIKGAGLTYGDLTPFSGTYTISAKSNFILENMDISGTIVIKNSSDVTIRNCRVVGVALQLIRTQGTCSNIAIENCEVRGSDEGVNEVVGKQWGTLTGYFKVINCDLSGAADGLKAISNTTIEGCYIHHLYRWYTDEWTHNDCVQILGGNNMVISGNTFLAPYQFSNAVMQCAAANGSIDNLKFENNYCSGGVWCTRFYSSNYGITNYSVSNNVYEDGSYASGALIAEGSPIIQCNVFVDGTLLSKNNTPCGATVPVTGVTVSPMSLSLTVGQVSDLTGDPIPSNATNKSVVWTSSDSLIATVNSIGLVTAIDAGNAIISATTDDGGYSATCIVTVTSSPSGGIFYCDPVNGSMSNNGSLSSPWSSLQALFAAGKTFNDGDIIYLMSGNHGYPVITDINTGKVTITKLSGASPVISRIEFNGAGNWTLSDVLLTSNGQIVANLNVPLEHPVAPLKENSLIYMESVNNITIDNCIIKSLDDNSVWTTTDDWNYYAWSGIMMRNGGSNVTVTNCYIKNVNFGTLFSASNSVYRNNTVENFCGDGIQFGCNNFKIENNIFKNSYNVNGNHDDIIQQYAGGSATHDVEIRGNQLINYSDPNQLFKGAAQALSLFDGFHTNYIIENNLITSEHWHGITLLGGTNCSIINNTVIDPSNEGTIGPCWIKVAASMDGTPSSANIVRNNICADLNNDAGIGIVENNIEISWSDYGTYFTDYANFDYHLKAGSPAIDAGLSTGAPTVDIEFESRPQGAGYDVGCYEYSGEIITVAGVSIPATLNLKIGESDLLSAAIDPPNATNQSVTWASSNPLVATVNDGTIIALAEGIAVITVTTNDGGLTDECNVTVTVPAGDYNLALFKPVSVINEEPDAPGTNLVDGDVSDPARWSADGFPQTAEIDLGEDCDISSLLLYTYLDRAYQYIIEACPDGGSYSTIVDRSNNTEGSQPITDAVSVTARHIKITVTGASVYTGTWVSLTELMVMGTPIGSDIIHVTSVSLDQSSLTLEEGQTSGLIKTVLPVDASDPSVTWSSDNTSIALVDANGYVSAISEGNCAITVTSVSDPSISASCAVSVTSVSGTTVALNPIADAFVRGGTYADDNYGNSADLPAKTASASFTRESFLKFDLSAISDPDSATLRLYTATGDAGASQTLYLVNDNSWSETGITYNNKPSSGSSINTSVSPIAGTYVEIDILATVKAQAGGLLSLQLVGNGGEYVSYSSREGANAPELVIVAHKPITGLSIAPTTLTLEAGQWANVTETVIPLDATNKTVTWSTSNANVATVDANGLVTAINGGSCTITVASVENASISATCSVNVTVPATSIQVSDLTLDLSEGGAATLSATVLPANASNPSVTWSSDNSSIATVDAIGNVSAISEGNCTITVTSVSNPAVSASCSVVVSSVIIGGTVTLNPIADAFVRDGTYAGDNYGNEINLDVKTASSSYTRESFLKFDLSAISNPTSAVLRLYANTVNSTQALYLVNDDSWTESGITYNNKPSSGGLIYSSVAPVTGAYVEIDILSTVQAQSGGLLSLQLVGNGGEFNSYSSREGENVPELVITAGTATPVALIDEDFSAGALDFTEISGGDWTVSGEQYVLSNPANGGTGLLGNIAVHNTEVAGDFELNTKIYITGTTSLWNDAAIVFNYQNINNYYYVSLNESNDGNTSGIFKVEGGTPVELCDITSSISTDVDIIIQIVKTGSDIVVYLNGSQLASASDATFTGGFVGYGSKNDGAIFDDLVVWDNGGAKSGMIAHVTSIFTNISTISNIKIYPNPCYSDALTLDIECDVNRPIQVCIFDVIGKKIYTDKIIPWSTGLNSYNLPTLGMKNGIYIIDVINGSTTYSEKIIVKR